MTRGARGVLLFTERPELEESALWRVGRQFDHGESGFVLDIAVDAGRHSISVRPTDGGRPIEELVAPSSVAPGAESVSSLFLPPYYRWECEALSCRFVAEWREGGPSVAASLRHMASLRRHPRSLVVDDEERADDLNGAPVSALVMASVTSLGDVASIDLRLVVEWRAWHVIDDNNAFDGPTRRVLATHTQVWG